MDTDQLHGSPEIVEVEPPQSLYDTLARSVDFADAPGRSTTMSVETTDKDNDPIPFC